MMTEEYIIERLRAAVRRAQQPPAPKPPEEKAKERWAEDRKPTVQVINEATTHNDVLTRRMQMEIAEGQDPRVRYQQQLDLWWQSKLDAEAELDAFDYSTGFKERRHKASCHRGRGDSDW
jgi:hypothetical protein